MLFSPIFFGSLHLIRTWVQFSISFGAYVLPIRFLIMLDASLTSISGISDHMWYI